MPDPRITVRPMVYQQETRIWVDLPYAPEFVHKIRSVAGARWSPEHRCWHVPRVLQLQTANKTITKKILVQ